MKQEMILTTEKLVFVTDPDESDKNIENLVTEFNTNLYRINNQGRAKGCVSCFRHDVWQNSEAEHARHRPESERGN